MKKIVFGLILALAVPCTVFSSKGDAKVKSSTLKDLSTPEKIQAELEISKMGLSYADVQLKNWDAYAKHNDLMVIALTATEATIFFGGIFSGAIVAGTGIQIAACLATDVVFLKAPISIYIPIYVISEIVSGGDIFFGSLINSLKSTYHQFMDLSNDEILSKVIRIRMSVNKGTGEFKFEFLDSLNNILAEKSYSSFKELVTEITLGKGLESVDFLDALISSTTIRIQEVDEIILNMEARPWYKEIFLDFMNRDDTQIMYQMAHLYETQEFLLNKKIQILEKALNQ